MVVGVGGVIDAGMLLVILLDIVAVLTGGNATKETKFAMTTTIPFDHHLIISTQSVSLFCYSMKPCIILQVSTTWSSKKKFKSSS